MSPTLMTLKILLPFRVFAEKVGVSRIVAETHQGSFGLLPHRLDCVAALSPGILIYETEAEGEVYVAVDEGVLVKTATDVLVSVRQALAGTDLGSRGRRRPGLPARPAARIRAPCARHRTRPPGRRPSWSLRSSCSTICAND